MAQLTLLPYELLQLIAENLLPRYQCRLAMVSSWCYQWLYNDLLRWHAKMSLISVPKYRVVDDIAVSIHCDKLVIYKCFDEMLSIGNLTNYTETLIIDDYDALTVNIEKDIDVDIFDYVEWYGIGIFDHCYKYMDRSIFVICASIRMSPLLSLPYKILWEILLFAKMNYRTMRSVHAYLGSISYNAYYW